MRSARRATAWPIRPMPMMPRRLPPMRWPSIQVGDQPGQFLPSVRIEAPSISRRGTARISAMVMSAVSSVKTFGVLVTVMPRAMGRDDLDIVDAVAEIGDQFQPAVGLVENIGVIMSVTVGTSDIGGADRLGDLLEVSGVSSRLSLASEQLAHPGLDRVRQLAGDDNERLFLNRHVLLS